VTDPGQDNFGGSAMGGPSVGQSARWDGAQWVPISQEPHLGQSAMWDGASWVTIQEHDGTRASESPPIPPNQPVEPNSRAAAKKTPWILAGIAAFVLLVMVGVAVGWSRVTSSRVSSSPAASVSVSHSAVTPTSVTPSPVIPSSVASVTVPASPASTTTTMSATTGPNAAFPGAVLTTAGLGPLTMGMSLTALQQGGYVVAGPMPYPCSSVANAALDRDGVYLGVSDSVREIWLNKGTYATRSGARVGMTVAQLRSIYGDNLVTVTKNGSGGPFQAPAIQAGDREVVFMTEWTDGTFTNASKIKSIVLRSSSKDMYGGCGD